MCSLQQPLPDVRPDGLHVRQWRSVPQWLVLHLGGSRGGDTCFAALFTIVCLLMPRSVGEKRKLKIPPHLGYGDAGAGANIPGELSAHDDYQCGCKVTAGLFAASTVSIQCCLKQALLTQLLSSCQFGQQLPGGDSRGSFHECGMLYPFSMEACCIDWRGC